MCIYIYIYIYMGRWALSISPVCPSQDACSTKRVIETFMLS